MSKPSEQEHRSVQTSPTKRSSASRLTIAGSTQRTAPLLNSARMDEEPQLPASDSEIQYKDLVSSSSPHSTQRELDFAAAVRQMLLDLGEDPERDGLRNTPERAARALQFFTRGYAMSVEAVVGDAVFDIDHNDMVLIRDIDISSLCEHHLLPFSGKAHIAYIPKGRVIGLSKMARIVEVFAARLQVQERLTRQVADSIQLVLAAEGVTVLVECSHMCMVMRGVKQSGTTTITQSKTGVFAMDYRLDEQFHALLRMAQRA